MKPLFTKGYTAEGDVKPYRIVQYGAADYAAGQAVDTTGLMGASGILGGKDGAKFDVIRTGITPIEFGGDVIAGQKLTADAEGRAVVAQPGEEYIAVAEESGDLGTFGDCWLEAGSVPAAGE
ncbi:hypothetical protein CFE14_RS15790 [Vibrio parahaemolyticus]|nr:hypothetical protein [Vibrio parahaemolyticus]